MPFINNTSGTSLTATYLIIAGGGGAAGSNSGNASGGGGGAGGYLSSTVAINSNSNYNIVVGAGGAGGAAGYNNGVQGSNSTFSAYATAAVGGGFGNNEQVAGDGGTGGSGGGSGKSTHGVGLGTAGQGNNGGQAGSSAVGGGGGSGGVGGSVTVGGFGGNGGAGTSNSITGSAVTYAGGGGGGGNTLGGSATGGGGAGGTSAGGSNASANLGGGGGGSSGGSAGSYVGGNGGSGIVIISYAGNQKFTGGTITSSGGNTIHTFTSSGSLTSIFNDQSPQGNNWTGNNFNVSTTGSTYDSMTDVPTLTSATAANYAVMNPLNGTGTLTNGNLAQAGASANWGPNTSSIAFPSTGNFYCEVYINSTTPASNGMSLGVCASTVSFANANSDPKSVANTYVWQNYLTSSNNLFLNTVGSVYNSGSVYTTGQTVGIQVNNGTLTFYKNNVSQGTATTGLTGNLCFIGGIYSTDNCSWNFGQQPFTYTPPTGAVGLNTYNL